MFNTVDMVLISFRTLFPAVCHCVKINSLKVPKTYTIETDETGESTADSLILDCEYEIGQNETGFVLKWLLKDNLIYQWIPYDKPYSHVSIYVFSIWFLDEPNYVYWKCKNQTHFEIYFPSFRPQWRAESTQRTWFRTKSTTSIERFSFPSQCGTWQANTPVTCRHSSRPTRSQRLCKSSVREKATHIFFCSHYVIVLHIFFYGNSRPSLLNSFVLYNLFSFGKKNVSSII